MFSFRAAAEADFTFEAAEGAVQNTGNSVTLTLGSSSEKSRVRFVYPFLPYKRWDQSDEIVLEKTVEGVAAARIAVPTSRDEKLTNQFGALRLSVRKTRLAAYRDGVEIAAVEDKSGKSLQLEKCFAERQLLELLREGPDRDRCRRRAAMGRPLRRRQHVALPVANVAAARTQRPVGLGLVRHGLRFLPLCAGRRRRAAYLFHGGHDSYAVNADPRMNSVTAARWVGNWVPRMLEQGVTATWGAVTEPYATFYARGGNVLTTFGLDTISATAFTSRKTRCAG